MRDQESTMTTTRQELPTVAHMCDTQTDEVVYRRHTVLHVEIPDATTELLDPGIPKSDRASIIW